MKVLCLLLLLAVAVPSGYAKPPSSSLMSVTQVEKGGEFFGQSSWLRKHLRAGLFALGIVIQICTGLGCDSSHKSDDSVLAGSEYSGRRTKSSADEQRANTLDYNHAEAADSLLSVLADIRGQQDKLYFYTRDDEARIGWLLLEGDEVYYFKRYRSPDNKPNFDDKVDITIEVSSTIFKELEQRFKDMKDVKVEVNETKTEGISVSSTNYKVTLTLKKRDSMLNLFDYFDRRAKLMIFTLGGEVVDLVSEHDVVGQLQSTAHPGFDYAYQDPEDGERQHVKIVASFVADDGDYESSFEEKGFGWGKYPRYVVLVTHLDGHELANDSQHIKVVETKHLSHLPH